MKLVFGTASAILALMLALPILLLLAVALGPVILGIICALACASVVFVLWNLAIGLGLLGRFLESAGMSRVRHMRGLHRGH